MQGSHIFMSWWIKIWRRYLRGSRNLQCLLLFFIGACFFAGFKAWNYHSSKVYNLHLSKIKKRLLYYCNPPGPPLGNEKNPPFEYSQFKLKQVHVIARHGDRSSVARNFADLKQFNCNIESPNVPHATKLKILIEIVKYLKIVRIAQEKEKPKNFYLSNRPICKPGQLTPLGYLQHIFLGEYMLTVYGRRLDLSIASVEEDEIFVYATPISRTQQSAAGFLSGMFGQLLLKNVAGNNQSIVNDSVLLKVRVSTDPLGYFREEENGYISSCPLLKLILTKPKSSVTYKNFKPLFDKIAKIFDLSREMIPSVTHLFDTLATHFCHQHLTPCGPGGCMDDALISDIFQALHRELADRFTPIAKVASHPLLSKITQSMLTCASGDCHVKFVLFVSHDTVVSPLLIDLGVLPNEWPAYAARIVFELWEAGEVVSNNLSGDDALDKHFVRVLYNGHDYTSRITFCQKTLKFGKLCPLRALVQALTGTSDNMETEYRKLCGFT